MPPTGEYDLWYTRSNRRRVPRRIISIDETDARFHQRWEEAQKQNSDNDLLDSRSKEVRYEIDTRLWATMYLQYLVERLHSTDLIHIEFYELPDLQPLSISDADSSASSVKEPFGPQCQSVSAELQVRVLERRLLDARLGTEATWATLSKLISKLTLDITNDPTANDIAFRVFDKNSQARYFESRGDIRCGNWQDMDVKRNLTRAAAAKHITGAHIPTDYISISTSPRRLWNIIDKFVSKIEQKVAVIDLRVLARLGIAYGSTTEDLGFCHTGNSSDRIEFATKHHVLVVGWVPKNGTLGFLSTEQFHDLLQKSQISTSSKTGQVSLAEYDKQVPFDLIREILRS